MVGLKGEPVIDLITVYEATKQVALILYSDYRILMGMILLGCITLTFLILLVLIIGFLYNFLRVTIKLIFKRKVKNDKRKGI